MGGWGSGRRNGKSTIEGEGSCRLRLKDLRCLLRSPNGSSVWLGSHWSGSGLPLLVRVTVEVLPDGYIYLRLRHLSRTDRVQAMDYRVGLTWTEAGFGGRRRWFQCPLLGHRCAVLYLPHGARQFGSAEGHGLAYDVTRMTAEDRLWHRMVKIAHRLGDDDPDPDNPPARPHSMSLATYDRLLAGWHDAAERRDDLIATKIAGLVARLGDTVRG